ncbi:MAG: YhgE/Pip domain-containing protein [Pseudobutyrivibrio sp.]|nr:YhgE/Pip domain-containing protein [Pseudobutyrivibrio sp.]
MKTIKRIFVDDVVGLAKNFFALVIVIGICFLPALYAWFNIYSNWDPYGNTSALKIAAVSMDKGYTDDDGEYHNQGDSIIENLHENTSVAWQFVDTSDEAINGVYSGKFYAAVVIDEDFTYNMYNVLTEKVDRPTLHFYENQKKNPVATKISDTVVQTLQNNINVAFTEVVVSRLFSDASEFSDEIEDKSSSDQIMDRLRSLSDDLTTYQDAINNIIENDAALQEALTAAEQDANNLKQQAYTTASSIKNSANVSRQADTTLNDYSDDIKEAMDLIETKTSEMNKYLDAAQASNDAKEVATNFQNALLKICEIEELAVTLPSDIGEEKINNTIEDVTGKLSAALRILEVLVALPKIPFIPQYDFSEQEAILRNAINTINSTDTSTEGIAQKVAEIRKVEGVINSIDIDALAAQGSDSLKTRVKNVRSEVSGIEDLITGDLRTKVDRGLTSLSGMLDNSNALLNNIGETFGNLVVMFNAINNTVDSANTSLQKTNEAIVYVNGRLIEVINDVENAGASEKLQVMVNALSGDPEMYGKFFSTPVDVVTEAVYPIENYGSAVAPFYSTLAFWVGALILTAIIKVKPDKSKYSDASERQLYFGRYALFWVLGQLQSLIIVLGDIFLLHVQCIHPVLFLIAGSVIATTFTLLIYSLVVTWGDAGKALAVVLVVIQIAGSSGTYPIELLPEFFKKVYIFFPFPYAINAIRECLCGMYKYDYIKYLASLIIFMGVALVIGLLVRIPFEPINHYMEERMEDTEMM